MRQSSFVPDTACRVDCRKRRSGRPQTQLQHFPKKYVYDQKFAHFVSTGQITEDRAIDEAAHGLDF